MKTIKNRNACNEMHENLKGLSVVSKRQCLNKEQNMSSFCTINRSLPTELQKINCRIKNIPGLGQK